MVQFTSTPLYGGAITAALPTDYGDARSVQTPSYRIVRNFIVRTNANLNSQIRQIPDNQEVYLSSTKLTSVIFDITERVATSDAATDEDALKFHFTDYVNGTNDESKILGASVATLSKMPKTPTYFLSALQTPRAQSTRPNRPQPDFVAVLLVLIRLEEKETDIVITINVPHTPGEYKPEEVDLEKDKLGPLMEEAMQIRQSIVETFEVNDYSLFG
jgi:hypothetical protein